MGTIDRGRTVLGLALILLVTGCSAEKQSSALAKDEVIAGSSHDFMEVRHLVLRGSNEEIGRTLATLARDRHGIQAAASDDPLRVHAQKRYLRRNDPILYARMQGVAAAYGKDISDDHYDFSGLSISQLRAGCSVVYYPPTQTADGVGILSRNYDFSTGTLWGTRPPEGQLPATARPYLVEMHPDHGHASLAICAYDLLSGVIDGVNSEGLTVALLADDELMERFRMEPAGEGVGLGVQQVLRMLLDTCANVAEAKEALLVTKQYYEAIPCHYLIADRHGDAFVWEYSQAHNREYIVDHPGEPLITTNFSLHRYMNGSTPPTADQVKKVCPRYCALAEAIAHSTEKFTVDSIKTNQHRVDAQRPTTASAKRPPGRTLWHALYFPERRSLQVSFYLGDQPAAEATDPSRIQRTEYLEFTLDSGDTAKATP